MTEKKTEEDLRQEALEKRGEELIKAMTNKQKREAVRYFDIPFAEFDGIDNTVLLAHVASGRSFDELDNLPLTDLEGIVLGQ